MLSLQFQTSFMTDLDKLFLLLVPLGFNIVISMLSSHMCVFWKMAQTLSIISSPNLDRKNNSTKNEINPFALLMVRKKDIRLTLSSSRIWMALVGMLINDTYRSLCVHEYWDPIIIVPLWLGLTFNLFTVDGSKSGWPARAWDRSYVQDWQEQIWDNR